ncbi:MAG TPA: hypothetical protein VJ873_11640, partial [bacterium]|nr:hypothetical protein [bacterium]
MKKSYWVVSILLVLAMSSSGYMGCNKTDHPFGIYAPNGLDVPSPTFTPQSGSINVYVFDNFSAVQGVSINLIDPYGNKMGPTTTQAGVGYAAFNPPNLYNGTWTAVVSSQSVSYTVSPSGTPFQFKRTYDYSTLPITIIGSGQYSVSFTTGGNSVSINPVSQIFSPTSPEFFP